MNNSGNPLEGARVAAGITRNDLALIAGCSYYAVYQAEMGGSVRPSPAVLNALKQFGFDPDELTSAYVAWRKARAQAFLAKRVAEA